MSLPRCLTCDGPIAPRYGKPKKYCCKPCQSKGQIIYNPPKTCESCGNQFSRKIKTSQIDWDKQRFCKPECAGRSSKTVTVTDGIGLTQEEIANRLGISRREVQVIEARAMKKLKNAVIKSPILMEFFAQ
jgi:hypothetical protein